MVNPPLARGTLRSGAWKGARYTSVSCG